MNSLSSTKPISQKMHSISEVDLNYPIKVAVVDDDDDERVLMVRAVEQSPDLEGVGSYRCGLKALMGIPSSASEVVLMDVRMPGMSGIECTRRLKNVRPNLIIIVISGLDQPDTLTQAL